MTQQCSMYQFYELLNHTSQLCTFLQVTAVGGRCFEVVFTAMFTAHRPADAVNSAHVKPEVMPHLDRFVAQMADKLKIQDKRA